VLTINTDDASVKKRRLQPGDSLRIEPLVPHQLFCIEEGTIIEVSSPDSVEDNYRVAKGDSQK
jgi:quercetin dioxygenase-like cupin family protein